MSKLQFNDVPFVPCNDCRHFQDCTDEAYRKGRDEAIEEFCRWYFDMKNDAQINAVDDLIKRFETEQLKEQKND